jgi:hypothetical protein
MKIFRRRNRDGGGQRRQVIGSARRRKRLDLVPDPTGRHARRGDPELELWDRLTDVEPDAANYRRLKSAAGAGLRPLNGLQHQLRTAHKDLYARYRAAVDDTAGMPAVPRACVARSADAEPPCSPIR